MWVVVVNCLVCLALGVLVGWRLSRRRPRETPNAAEANGQAAGANRAVEELTRLTGGLAHEIRNPLSTLKVNLQLLSEDWQAMAEEEDLTRRSLNRIEAMSREITRLSDILDDFLRFVSQQQLDLKPNDLNQLVKELIGFYRPQAQSHRVRILTSLDDQPLLCNVDADLFKQALLNLFINAQQAMPDGGELIVRTARQDDRAKVTVTDTGRGIPAEHLPKIFDAYFSTKKAGTGLGLATTKKIITRHGGDITVHSEEGKGTSFTITLPMEMR